jgi:UDP-glucose 4-epimerase
VVSNPLASLHTNVRGNDVVIASAAMRRRPLLYTSTSEVYGKNTDGALGEDSDRVLGSSLKSRWNYAIAKSYGEALIHAYYRESGAPATVVRLFNTVGPRQTGRYGMVLPRLVRQALDGRDLTVYGHGTQTRCFAHVQDVVRAITLLLGRNDAYGRAFNVGSSAELSILELARRVIDRTGSSSNITFISYEDAYGEGFEELGKRRPDTGALWKLTGWQPMLTIDDAIDDLVVYEREQRPARPDDIDELEPVAL